ncbi:MAG: AAA-like domain-containing protein [Bacteroidia bacterium]
MRSFNTSGPNILSQHYTLLRPKLIAKGKNMVNNSRYFTIWAPRQTGKSTYFRLLATELEKNGYEVAHINFENYREESKDAFLGQLRGELTTFWQIDFSGLGIAEIFYKIQTVPNRKLVLIIDEIEGINPDYFSAFLHSIRAAYHSRERHSLKSVILVGVSNITGVIQDNASPFNANDNLNIPYFSKAEILELLAQHETETEQLFSPEVKEKIAYITAGQPGLVNGFGYNLVENFPDEKVFQLHHYMEIEKNYTSLYIDKNISNIINKGKQHREFIKKLLFDERKMRFEIYDERIKFLTVNGLITHDENKNIIFNVPLYKKCLQVAFSPSLNGEFDYISGRIDLQEYLTESGQLNVDKIIRNYQDYAKKRGFRYFMEKDEKGNNIGLKEAALVYSFDTYIQAFLVVMKGKSYLEPHVALGRSDLIVNIQGTEFVIEAKIFNNITQFNEGKIQLAYYLNSLGLKTGIYLVFMDSELQHKSVKDETALIEGVEISTYIVRFDVEKDFSEDLRKVEGRAKKTYKKKD